MSRGDPITLIMAYYINKSMLQYQYKRMSELSPELRAGIHLIIVDDGSPKDPAFYPETDIGLLSIKLYRMEKDIRWNQDACRNIGVRHSQTDFILLTDMDHVVPADTWRHLLGREWDNNVVYTFQRKKMPKLDDDKPHPNSWFMNRRIYNAMGGYDERFAGIYGTDGDFKKRAQEIAEIKMIKGYPLIVYPRSVIPDASTTTYLRKQPEDDVGKRRVKSERELDEDKRPKNFLFPYHFVEPPQ